LRWRIFERMRRFLRPNLRRPFPVFFVPTSSSCRLNDWIDCLQIAISGLSPRPPRISKPEAGRASARRRCETHIINATPSLRKWGKRVPRETGPISRSLPAGETSLLGKAAGKSCWEKLLGKGETRLIAIGLVPFRRIRKMSEIFRAEKTPLGSAESLCGTHSFFSRVHRCQAIKPFEPGPPP
jgi:hypothetical protein